MGPGQGGISVILPPKNMIKLTVVPQNAYLPRATKTVMYKVGTQGSKSQCPQFRRCLFVHRNLYLVIRMYLYPVHLL
jgi:hypothetical protein